MYHVISMFYTSNERDYLSLSADIHLILRMNISVKRYIWKCIFFTFVFQSSISDQIMSFVSIYLS